MGGPTDVLVRKGPVGPGVALTHHTLADEVDAAHDEEGQDDADDRPDGAAVGRAVIRRRLGDLCPRAARKRQRMLTARAQALPWGRTLCVPEGPFGPSTHGWTVGRGRCWGPGAQG